MNKLILKIVFTASIAFAAALTLSCSGDDGDNPAISSSSENAEVSSSSEQGSNYSSSGQSESSSSSSGLDIENSSSSNITDISSSSEQVESSSSSSSPVTENSSSSSKANISSSSGQAGNVCASLNNYIMAVELNLNGEPVVVRKNGEVLVKGVNYEVIETQNSVKVQGLEDYIGSVERTSVPANALDFVVRDGEKVLTEGTDYEVINTGNIIKFVGINNYAGSVKIELQCEPEPVTPPVITTASLPPTTAGETYSEILAATGDTPIIWSVHSGALPDGLSLNANTGLISGTPIAAGTFSIIIRATNIGGYDEKSFSIVVTKAMMYHGHIWTVNPTSDELSRIISGELAYSGISLSSSEVTIEGKTITFNGSGVRCIMIPKTIGQITSLRDALNTENLGSVFLFRGDITCNGIDYYLYTGPFSTIDGLDFNLIMSF